ncbi:AGAP005235-PA-like protein [Anopheles sinensis]|uniref:AGAP005235-PA-like protein n=1 Tax=Anopheles sinensis TaxID=74873 RepID=A0A084WRX9_ANOSI|nr:AGAP005235-PA-like protein [Anopheles sinensis]
MSQLETLEAKMANIEVSLCAGTPRRRKGTSLGGSLSARSSPRPDSAPARELRTALQDREAVIQSLRLQLGLGKLPRPTGPPLDETERPVAEQRLAKLKSDAETKRQVIRNLKTALEKLDVTDNIDVRIRQAELEYALGREELQLLSLVEEARALQGRLDKPKQEPNTLYGMLQSGANLMLLAVRASTGRWNASTRNEQPGFWVDWVLDGEGLQRGDRIIEINGKAIGGRNREEMVRAIGSHSKSEIVIARMRKPTNGMSVLPQSQLQQSQADNVRLQHRISYLEDQVKELLGSKELHASVARSGVAVNGTGGAHITSISITSPPSTPPEAKTSQPSSAQHIYNYIDERGSSRNGSPAHVTTTTIIKECDRINGELTNGGSGGADVMKYNLRNSLSSSKISINGSASESLAAQYYSRKERDKRERENRRQDRERYLQQFGAKLQRSTTDLESDSERGRLQHSHSRSHARSVEYLNGERKRLVTVPGVLDSVATTGRRGGDVHRTVKSLDFESDTNEQYASEPSGPKLGTGGRPAPPKKPLRLSLQRAQSLQTVDGIVLEAMGTSNGHDRKRAMKRSHKSGTKVGDPGAPGSAQYIENSAPMQTASLGRHKYI